MLGTETMLMELVGLLLAWLEVGPVLLVRWMEYELLIELAYRLGLAAYASLALSTCSSLAVQLLDHAG